MSTFSSLSKKSKDCSGWVEMEDGSLKKIFSTLLDDFCQNTCGKISKPFERSIVTIRLDGIYNISFYVGTSLGTICFNIFYFGFFFFFTRSLFNPIFEFRKRHPILHIQEIKTTKYGKNYIFDLSAMIPTTIIRSSHETYK